jgi:hypothetical protein
VSTGRIGSTFGPVRLSTCDERHGIVEETVKLKRQIICTRAMSVMAELDVIAATLRHQKKDLRELKATTASRSGETAELVSKIEDLRRRREETQRRFQAEVSESESKEKK